MMFYAFDNNISNVFIQIRSRGDALYQSNIVKINSNVQNNFDPLAHALLLGDLLNIKVHAWVNTYLLWSSPSPPKDTSHIYYSNPEWFDLDINDNINYNPNLATNEPYQWKGIYLSPNNPKVNLYILDLVKEIVSNYPNLSGLHFDYIRFQDKNYGFNKVGVQNFKNNHGFNPKDIINGKIYKNFGWNDVEADSISNLWFNSNKDNIINLLRSVKKYVDNINTNLLISAAVKSNPIESKNRWFQDWAKWIEDDIVDFVIPMNYAVDSRTFMNNIKNIKTSVDNNEKVVMGISLYNQDEKNISEKILLAKYGGYDKICLFSYETIKNNNINLESVKYEYLKKTYMFKD